MIYATTSVPSARTPEQPSQQGEEAPAPTPPYFSLSRACTRSPKHATATAKPRRHARSPWPLYRATDPRNALAAPRASRPCPRRGSPRSTAPPRRAPLPRPWRAAAAWPSHAARSRPAQPRSTMDRWTGTVLPRSTPPPWTRPVPQRHVASQAGHPRWPWPFCKKPPVDFSN